MKNIKKSLLGLGVSLLMILPLSATSYKIDTSHSALLFSIQHLGLGNTWGRFNAFDGTIVYDPSKLEASSVSVTAKIASVDTDNKKRDDHLRNTDVFDAGTYPEMKFEGKGFKSLGDKKYEVKGTLTIRDKSLPLTVVLKKIGEGKHFFAKKPAIGFETEFIIDRRAYGVGQGKVDNAMGGSVRIIAALEAIAQ